MIIYIIHHLKRLIALARKEDEHKNIFLQFRPVCKAPYVYITDAVLFIIRDFLLLLLFSFSEELDRKRSQARSQAHALYEASGGRIL